ncbi:MAG: S1C family serine protease [candidate division Zixibacteria bacterium]|nr:S1C family serine protease [candidate division Zixibacteria bacterium]
MKFSLNSTFIKTACLILPVFILSGCSRGSHLERMQSEIYEVMDKVGPSVVSISAVNRVDGSMKIGSGVVLDKDFILTTENLLQNSDELKIKLQDGTTIGDSEIADVYCDFETNVSLIKLKKGNLKPVRLAKKEQIRNGTLGLIIGNTNYSKGLQVALGTVGSSWIGGIDPYDQELLVVSANFCSYQAGTPIFNYQGELLGLAEGKLEGKDNVILVLPASTCEVVGRILKQDGQIKRGWIGIYSNTGRSKLKQNRSEGEGVKVSEVDKDGPAFKQGVKVGDLIIGCDGKKIKGEAEFRKMISKAPIGSEVRLLLSRDGQKMEKLVKVETSKNMPVFRRCPNRCI